MRIALIGAQNTGKSTLVEKFLEKWPMYNRPLKTYRDIIKEKNLPLNKQGTKESQRAILDALCEELQQSAASDSKFTIFDRCPVDNIAYTLWHYAKDTPGFDKEFIVTSQSIASISLKMLDVIFYIPIRKEIPIVEREGREADLAYREEIDNIYDALVTSYEKNTGAFFPLEDCPPVIRLEGPPDLRIPQIQLYIKENGCFYGEEDGSLISDLSNV